MIRLNMHLNEFNNNDLNKLLDLYKNNYFSSV